MSRGSRWGASDGRLCNAPWPLAPDTRYPDTFTADSDADGKFTFADLPPGKYRIIAVGDPEWARKEEPNVMAGWFTDAQEITLEERQMARVTVEAK